MRFYVIVLIFFSSTISVIALYESKLGKIDAGATLKLSYDSRVFGMPSNEFQAVKDSNSTNSINPSRLQRVKTISSLHFSPAVHFTNKFGLLKIKGARWCPNITISSKRRHE